MEDWAWQEKLWDTRLRTAEQYSEKWLYVQENPLRQGLMEHMEDWPIKARVHELRW